MRTSDFDFELPQELIAQHPAPEREGSRLLVFDRNSGAVTHAPFRALPGYLQSGDLLVLNDSRVIPARLRGVNAQTGGAFELLLLEENATNDWWAMLRPGKRARVGTRIVLQDTTGAIAGIEAVVTEKNEEGHRRLSFTGPPDIHPLLETLGELPLPPYIHRDQAGPLEQDRERYQTVFARVPGSVAAPTAGLHFTEPLLDEIRARGIQTCLVTLHVGLGTFAPVKSATLEGHVMHEERFEISAKTMQLIHEAKNERRRVVAVGTTSLRLLETLATINHSPGSGVQGKTRIFIYPPYHFKIVDALLTNFHLPRSTLLMLVSAFAAPNETRGRDLVLAAYTEAMRERYRFFSYGDAMLLV